MVRWPTHRKARSPIPRLQSIVEAGLTTTYAIGLAANISEKEIALLMVGRIEPTKDQRERLDKLLKNYKLVIKLVNAEPAKSSRPHQDAHEHLKAARPIPRKRS